MKNCDDKWEKRELKMMARDLKMSKNLELPAEALREDGLNDIEIYAINSNIMQNFGDRVRLLRLERRMSQENFANKIGMDRSYYASIESGNRNVSLRNIEKIAVGLNVALEYLFKGI